MSLIKEFWDFMKVRKKFWLAPILIVLVILSGFIVSCITVASGGSIHLHSFLRRAPTAFCR